MFNNRIDYLEIAEHLISLKDNDLTLRSQLLRDGQLGDGYNEKMQKLHELNTQHLDAIIEKIGFPTIELVGEEASEAAWFIIQHSIDNPGFMRKCAIFLRKAVEDQQANPINLAYLTDRILTFEGKDQLYGTSFDWDREGELSPTKYDDIHLVNARRRSVGLPSLEEQIKIVRLRAEAENETPPYNYQDKKLAYDRWRKEVGWI